MNKTELIDEIAKAADISKASASRALEAVIESITSTLKHDGSVTLAGFGTFAVSARAARTGRNPRTGEVDFHFTATAPADVARTAAEARFSIAYVVANALLYGSVRLAAFSPERLADPAVRALMAKIELSVDADIDRAFPGQRAARVTIQTRDGQVAEHFQPTRKGDPDAPLSDQDLSEKFIELTQPVLGEAASQNLLAALWRLEQCADVLTL